MSENQIKKSIVILKSQMNSTSAAEHFLRNREWKVYSTQNLKDFLSYLISNKPSFAMISTDHPNEKVITLPIRIMQSFPVCVFAFAENPNAVAYRRLLDAQATYRINPPATGPAIERAVNKYLKDQERKLKDELAIKNAKNDSFKDEFGNLGRHKKKGHQGFDNFDSLNNADPNFTLEKLLEEFGEGSSITTNHGSKPTYDISDFESHSNSRKKTKSESALSDLKRKHFVPNEKSILVLGKNSSEQKIRESIIVKGTKEALDESVEIKDGVVRQEIEDSSQIACIIIESNRFNGYLIAALGKNRKMDIRFTRAIQERLFRFLRDNGEVISETVSLNIKIQKVEFQEWALEYADFLRKSVHNGDEIAMAFFPVQHVLPQLGESAQSTMSSVRMSDMEGDKTVDFNLYIYLPNNRKYILYTPKGSMFYSDQKSRLAAKGVDKVHLLKSEVNELSKYKVQNYLNTLIENYNRKRSAMTA